MDITIVPKSEVLLLLACLLFDIITTVWSGNFILYDNPVTCHAGVMFNTTVPSVLACAAICHRHSGCMGMLYNTSRCIGCDKSCSSLDTDLSSALRCWDLKSEEDIMEPKMPPLDCLDLYLADRLAHEGVYIVSTKTTSTRDLYCMEDGYTVFLKRNTGEVAFDKAFSKYENGFGDMRGDFWLGLRTLHELTNGTESYLKIKSCCKNGAPGTEIWTGFSVGPKPDYMLHIGKLDFASYADTSDYTCMGVVQDVERINRRLQMIENTIAEERLQRREDVQTVLDKLSELQTTISVNHRNDKENDNEDSLDSKLWTQLVKQMVHAMMQEKMMNIRFQREVQDQLAEQSKIYDSKKFVTQNDLLSAKGLIIQGILDRLTELETEIVYRLIALNNSFANSISNVALSLQNNTNKTVVKQSPTTTSTTEKMTEFGSCLDLYHAGFTTDGIYEIQIKGRYMDVYCDQTTDGVGWIVFQRRQDGSVDFYRNWTDYKHGFGDLDGEFWLGNDALADLTEDRCHELRVELGDVDENTRYAKYRVQSIERELLV